MDRGSGQDGEDFGRQVAAEAARRLAAQRGNSKSVWRGLGSSGLIGWSVAVPTVLGAALGIWIDRNYPGRFSWTLMLLFTGLLIGCTAAWRWVDSEYRNMHGDKHG